MNKSDLFGNLNFRARPRRVPARLWIIGAAFVIFTLLSLIVPQSGLYWLLLPVILCLTWAASYGWRPAVAASIQLLHWILEL
jgi:hypothetical protein